MKSKENFCKITVFSDFQRLDEEGKVVLINTDYVEYVDMGKNSVGMASGKIFHVDDESCNRLSDIINGKPNYQDGLDKLK